MLTGPMAMARHMEIGQRGNPESLIQNIAEDCGITSYSVKKWVKLGGMNAEGRRKSGSAGPAQVVMRLMEACNSMEPLEWLCRKYHFRLRAEPELRVPKGWGFRAKSARHYLAWLAASLDMSRLEVEIGLALMDGKLEEMEKGKVAAAWDAFSAQMSAFVLGMREAR